MKKERFKKIIDSKRLFGFFSILLNVFALLAFAVFQTPQFDTMDDPMMAMLVENASGNSEGVILFSNIVYVRLLQFIYSVIPNVKWYTIVQIICIYFSLSAVTFIFYKRFKLYIGTIVNSVFLLVAGNIFYYNFQFTKTAAICGIAGILLVFDSFELNKKLYRYIEIALGAVLILFSSWIRFNSLGMISIVMAGIGICKIIDILKSCDDKKLKLKKIVSYVLVFVIAFGISLPTYIVNVSFYRNNETYIYNDNRSKLHDFGFPDYDNNVDLYQELGISKNDYDFFTTANLDLSVLNNNTVKKLAEAKNKRTLSYILSDNFKNRYISLFLYSKEFLLLLILMLILVIINYKRSYYYVITFMLMFLLQTYLAFIGRLGLGRINDSVYIALIVAFIYSFSNFDFFKRLNFNIKLNKEFVKRNVALCLAFVYLFVCVQYAFFPEKPNEDQNKLKQFYSLVSNDKDNLYLSLLDLFYIYEGEKVSIIDAVDFYEPMKPNQVDNIYHLGSWYCNFKTNLAILDKYGVENPYKDSINNDNVIVLSQDKRIRDKFITYIRDNYDSNAKIELVKKINGLYQWRIVNTNYNFDNINYKTLDDDIVSNVKIKKSNKKITINGICYKKNYDSYSQRCFVVFTTPENKKYSYEIELKNSNLIDRYNGEYSALCGNYSFENSENCSVSIIMKADNDYYKIV